MADMHGLKDTAKRNDLIERLQFDVHTPIRKMSKGMKQKVGIVAAFMHSPEVIILDEPTSGLDPLMQKYLLKSSSKKSERNDVLMSSHSFPEIERTCGQSSHYKRRHHHCRQGYS